jgi:hypothetical protein
MRLRLNTEG